MFKVFYLLIPVVLACVIMLFFPYYVPLLFKFPSVLFRFIKDLRCKDLRLFGIYGFIGDVGDGKTISMVHELDSLRKTYGNKIYITTNFGYIHEDFPFSSYEDLLIVRDRPLIVAWDEVQNEFSSRLDPKKFPTSLLSLLTQNRKNNGIRIYWTCQHLCFIDKIFRLMTNEVRFCHTILGNYTYWVGCSVRNLTSDLEKRKSFWTFGNWRSFIQTEKLRSEYNSFQILESAKKLGYGNPEYCQEALASNSVESILKELNLTQ